MSENGFSANPYRIPWVTVPREHYYGTFPRVTIPARPREQRSITKMKYVGTASAVLGYAMLATGVILNKWFEWSSVARALLFFGGAIVFLGSLVLLASDVKNRPDSGILPVRNPPTFSRM